MIWGKSASPGRRALSAYKFEEMLCMGKRLTAQESAEHYIVMKAVAASRAKTAEERV
jgi:hypothetical protein